MTTDDRRRAWLKREMRKVPWVAKPCNCAGDDRGHVVYEPNYPALAALLDAPLREMEEAAENMYDNYRDAPYEVAGRLLEALARLPWREEGTTR